MELLLQLGSQIRVLQNCIWNLDYYLQNIFKIFFNLAQRLDHLALRVKQQ